MKIVLTTTDKRTVATVEVGKAEMAIDAPGLKLRLSGGGLERPREISVRVDPEEGKTDAKRT